MKKILTVALMLCIFTAMAVGTAAAKPTTVQMSSTQMQNVQACGFKPQTCATEFAGAAAINGCFVKGAIGGAYQTATASACVGSATICQGQSTCVAICT